MLHDLQQLQIQWQLISCVGIIMTRDWPLQGRLISYGGYLLDADQRAASGQQPIPTSLQIPQECRPGGASSRAHGNCPYVKGFGWLDQFCVLEVDLTCPC